MTSTTMSKADKLIRKARVDIMLTQHFFGSLLMCAPIQATTSVPTAATDMTSIFYNPEFIEKLSPEHVRFVLAHEVLHKALAHGLRRNNRDGKLWNIACDYAINAVLREAGFKVLEGALIDSKYGKKSSEEIYDILHATRETYRQHGVEGPSSNDVLGTDLQEPKLDPEQRAVLEREIKQQVAQAATTARMAGELTGGLERLVSAVLEPQVPWSDVLREYMVRIAYDQESWSHRNRRIQHAFLPARRNPTMGPVVIIGDTSGSITQKEFDRVAAEIQSVSDQLRPESIRVVWADAVVSSEQVFECNEPLDLKPTGGGGTDMRVPLKHVEQYEPQVVVLITDGETPWPTQPPDYPLIVCCTTDKQVPVGDTIRL